MIKEDIRAIDLGNGSAVAEDLILPTKGSEKDIAAVDFDTPGIYKVEGTIKQISDQTDQNKPFLASRADPTITEYNGKYYFISTTEDTGGVGLYIREADTVTGINKALQHLIFDIPKAAALHLI